MVGNQQKFIWGDCSLKKKIAGKKNGLNKGFMWKTGSLKLHFGLNVCGAYFMYFVHGWSFKVISLNNPRWNISGKAFLRFLRNALIKPLQGINHCCAVWHWKYYFHIPTCSLFLGLQTSVACPLVHNWLNLQLQIQIFLDFLLPMTWKDINDQISLEARHKWE